MAKRKLYLVVDTETATLPFVNELVEKFSNGDETLKQSIKQKVSIAKPLVYDIGWVVIDKKGRTYSHKNYLVKETYSVDEIFQTAYYRKKRKKYEELLQKGEIELKDWYSIMQEFAADLDKVDISTAYNAPFDFKKAISFTNRYIYHIYYKKDGEKWLNKQLLKCINIMKGRDNSKNEDYLNPTFTLFKKEYPICDLWGITCEKLINKPSYKDFCLENNYLTKSMKYYSTTAETVYKFLTLDNNFEEQHTALNDAEIESVILLRVLKKCGIKAEIAPFPFRILGKID